MEENPQISVIMSTYNEPIEWLSESIDSILIQNFSDFEFIIINDNPNANKIKTVLKEYEAKDKRIKLIYNNVNIGLTKSLNKGLTIAKGIFIARMDADDISKPERLKLQYEFLKSNSSYVGCGSQATIIMGNQKTKRIEKRPIENLDIQATLFYESPILHPSLFFRNMNFKYNELYETTQDYDFISQLASNGKLYNLKDCLIYYRKSSNQISSTKIDIQNNNAQVIRNQNIINFLKVRNTTTLSQINNLNPQELEKLINISGIDNKIKSALMYSYLFYFSAQKSIIYIFKIVFFYNLEIPIKYKIRLLLSPIKKFKDQLIIK